MKSNRLINHVSSAYTWTAVSNLFRYCTGFAISIVLARLLPPSAYGLIGMVIVVIGFAEVLQNIGLSEAIIYFREDTHFGKFFTISGTAGILLALACWAAAPLISRFYHEPQVTVLVRVLSLTLPLISIKSVSVAVLSRELRFREIAIVESVTSVGCGLVAIVLAWMGLGVWSLVWNLTLLTITQTLVFARYVRPRFTWHTGGTGLTNLLRWGMPLTGATLLWQFYNNADYLVVGRMMGSEALGWYTFAFRLATLLNDKISSVINRVSLPSLSSMREDRVQLIEHWFSVSRKLALVNFPLLTALAANSNELILVTVGPKWLPAALPLKFLCVTGALKTVLPLIPNVLSACGRTVTVFRYTLLSAIVLPLSFAVGCHYGGLLGVGVAWCVIQPILSIFLIIPAVRLVNVSLRSYLMNLKEPALVAGLCLLAMLPFGFLPAGVLSRLILRSFAGLACYIVCLWQLGKARNAATMLRGLVIGLRAGAAPAGSSGR